ncbi:hypothetical protein [Anaerotignum propionicum]|uniref:hypothetical protein n=1 Tax=Anaerotignum propionicum TaxID=28446 RepID=UPI00210CAACB|nr:hypothetical protein [Anaerotignum propionicum]MCQ4935958.1 hypothetical protein [Anaerotignum propionicum]
MKKIVIIVLSAFVIFFMAACNAPSKAEVFSEEKFLEDITPNLVCLNSCVHEMFGAEVDFNEDSYLAAYESESAYADGMGDIALLFKPGEESKYVDYFIDPTCSDYYPVTNFKTNAEVRDYLRKYLSDEVIDKWFSNDFLEYEGQLYLIRGSRGYGAMKCDLESLKYVEEKDDKQYVTVDFKLFDTFDHTETLEFSKVNDVWIMTDEVVPPIKETIENSDKEVSEETIIPPKMEDYSGSYVDRQGTAEIYNNLDLTYLEDESYQATIGLYRLTELEGVAKVDGETLSFKDDGMQVKGTIIIKDNMAVLTITESGFEYINQGDVFEFSEKL